MLLNIDLGELPGEPEELYVHAHVANLACGGHAGDEGSMRRALERCAAHGTRAGAHPSYPDRAGFGRTAMTMSRESLLAALSEQCARLAALARPASVRLGFLKAHGALVVDPHAAAERARRLARSLEIDTVCVHGDTPGAVAIARAVREALDGSTRKTR